MMKQLRESLAAWLEVLAAWVRPAQAASAKRAGGPGEE